jgi:predicted Zn finger-like uncharacterized protein
LLDGADFMPFIVQCPHADCRKFMLLEDSARGDAVECLLCKKPIKLEARSSAGSPAPAAPSTAVWRCPHCQTSLRLPADKTGDLKCPKCRQTFAAPGAAKA